MKTLILMGLVVPMALSSCEGTGDDDDDDSPGSQTDAEEAAQVAQNARWGENVSVSVSGETLVIQSNGLPDHEYLDVYVAEDRDGSFFVNPQETQQRFELPLVPEYSDTVTTTSGGAIGIAISGAVYFNPYEGDQQTYAVEDNYSVDGVPFIDACNGHPDQTGGNFHYHGVPYCITDVYDTEGQHSVLIGYLRDGFPIYGPLGENGEVPTDLDECLGHDGPTPEFKDGIYHYHTSEQNPYISKCYHGVVSSGQQPPPGGGQPPPP